MKIFNKKIVLPIISAILFFLVLPSKAKAVDLLGKSLFEWAIGGIPGLGGIVTLVNFGSGIAADIANNILIALINVIFQIPLIVTGTLNFIAAALVATVIDPNFLGVRITGPENTVVYEAWKFVRDFANMGFILALVAIGLGTALKYGEYQLQKALPRLLIIALLINFTPVFVGLFIDAANITISFLVGEAVGKNLLEMSKLIYGASGELASSFGRDYMEVLAAATAQIFFNLLSVLINLLFFLLFFFRYVALMMLFILSPLAFFAWILPVTRGFWDLWWRQFISWLLVGVFGAFFLLLSAQMAHFMWDAKLDIPPDIGGQAKSFSNFFAVFLVASLPIAFLWMGFLITISTSAMGAQRVISIGKTAGAWAGKKGWERGKTYAKEKWQKSPAAERISKRLSLAQAPEEVKIMGRKIPVVSQVAKWGAATSAATGRAIGRAGLAAREIGITDVGREEEAAKKRGVEMKASHLLSPEKTKTQRQGTYFAAYEQGQLKHLEMNLEKAVGAEKKQEIINKLGREAMEIHPDLFRRFATSRGGGEWVENIAESFHMERRKAAGMVLTDKDREKGYSSITDKLVAEMKTEDIAKMAPSALNDEKVKEATHLFWGGPQIAIAARTFGRDFVDEFNEGMKRRGDRWYTDNNPKATKYVSRNTAQELGLRPLKKGQAGTEDVPGLQKAPPPPPPGAPPPPPGVPPGKKKRWAGRKYR